MAQKGLVTVYIRGVEGGSFALVSTEVAKETGLQPVVVETQDPDRGFHDLKVENLNTYLVEPEPPKAKKKK